MFLGKWNRSVIITYLGVAFAVAGILLVILSQLEYAICCLIVAGICDLFDGVYARRCKRNEEEKEFGVQLDSLADVMDFIALPIAVFIGAGLKSPGFILLFAFFAICGIARLAYFNMNTASTKGPIEYYSGLPVTYTALIVPLVLLLKYVLVGQFFVIILSVVIVSVSALNILKVKVKKPRGLAYVFFSLLAIAMLVVYTVVL